MAIHKHSIRDSTCSMCIGRDVTSIHKCYVGAVDCSCTISCRRSARGMCSMNTSSLKGNDSVAMQQVDLGSITKSPDKPGCFIRYEVRDGQTINWESMYRDVLIQFSTIV